MARRWIWADSKAPRYYRCVCGEAPTPGYFGVSRWRVLLFGEEAAGKSIIVCMLGYIAERKAPALAFILAPAANFTAVARRGSKRNQVAAVCRRCMLLRLAVTA